MKVAICIATHNKDEALNNVFYSISRQKTSFPFEVVIVDDASEDITGLMEAGARHLEAKGVPHKVMFLSRNVGCGRSQAFCLDLLSEGVDTIVLQSADVLYASDDVLERLCRETAPGRFALAEVRNVLVDPELWRSWDKNLPYYLEFERQMETLHHINSDPDQPHSGSYTIQHTIFSGPGQPRPLERFYFFLGAIRKDDLLETCFAMNCMDKAISNDLHRLGKECVYVDAVGLHQRHPIRRGT